MKKLLLIALRIVGCDIFKEDEICCYIPIITELNLNNCEYNYSEWNCIDSVITALQWDAGSQDVAIDSVIYFVDDIFVKKAEIDPFLYVWGKPNFEYGKYELKAHIYLYGYTHNSTQVQSEIRTDSVIVNLNLDTI